MKRFCLAFSLLCCLSLSLGAQRIGDWVSHQAYHNATQCVYANDKVYALYDGNLLSFSPSDSEMRTYSKVEGLSGHDIVSINYSSSAGVLLLVYLDGNIDIIDPKKETISQAPQLKNNSVGALTVNDVSVYGNNAYIATSLGVAEFDLKKRELHNFYNFGQEVISAARNGDNIYAAMKGSGIKWGSTTDNLLDMNYWKTMLDNWGLAQLVSFDGYIYLRGLGSIFARFSNPNDVVVINYDNFNYLSSSSNALIVGNDKKCYYYVSSQIVPTIYRQTLNHSDMALGGGYFWAATGEQGLQPMQQDTEGDSLKPVGSALFANSPMRDLCYYMRYQNNQTFVVGGRVTYDGKRYPGTVMAYDGLKWNNFEEPDTIKNGYYNLTTIAQDPTDATHYFVSSGNVGLFEFKSGKFVKNYSMHNSPLKSFSENLPCWVRVDALNFDDKGNLWMTNASVDSVICILKKDGSWTKLYNKDFKKIPSPERSFFDENGCLWVTSRRTTSQAGNSGILKLNYGGTIDDVSDDQWTFRNSFINQDGTTLTPDLILTITEDHNGQIWAGTSSGVFVIEPTNWEAGDFRVTQPKIPRNDGTNFADYLLSDIPVSTIAVDKLNRKWIGTEKSGVYLVSADGTEVLQQFTSANSKLPSDEIYSISINDQSGEILFGTSEGIISFISDASDKSQKISKNDILVYPNPVRSDYYGTIHISGLPEGQEIRITSSTGQVVATGTSSLGSYDWDGRDLAGRKVKSGVYFVLLNNSEGKNSIATKLTIVR